MREIGWIRKKIERESIGLDPGDPKSTRICQWVEKTRTSIISASNDIVRLAQEGAGGSGNGQVDPNDSIASQCRATQRECE